MVFLTKVVFGLTIFAIGAIVGSLCSTYIYRAQNGIAITKGKSMCPYCEKQIKIYNLIPIISFIVLEGRCKLCNGRIPWESFVLETLCGITAITIFVLYEGSPKIFVIFFSLAVLLCVFLLDPRTVEIPNELSIALLVLGVSDSFFSTDISLLDRGIGLVIISIPMFLLALAVNNAFGGGDIKLIASAGFLLGWSGVLFATFVGLLIGGVQGCYILAIKKHSKETLFAFGPALSIGIANVLLFDQPGINGYINLIL